jgi:hypothetical protein
MVGVGAAELEEVDADAVEELEAKTSSAAAAAACESLFPIREAPSFSRPPKPLSFSTLTALSKKRGREAMGVDATSFEGDGRIVDVG